MELKCMDKLRIGIIGTRGRERITKFWYKHDGNSIVVDGADINENHLKQIKNEIKVANGNHGGADSVICKDFIGSGAKILCK